MFFCQNCDNMYSITKNIPVAKQQGGGEESDTPMTVSHTDTSKTSKTRNMRRQEEDYESIIKNLINNEPTDILDHMTLETVDKITKSSSYKKLSGKDKEHVYNKIMEYVPQADKSKQMETTTSKSINIAYFICKNCGYSEQILPGTLVMSRVSSESVNEYTDHAQYKNMIKVKTLPLTRQYVCPNKICDSHTDYEKREAVFFRTKGSYRVRYICKACETSWI